MMKKKYEQPMAEKIDFNYRDTVVASNTSGLNLKPNPNGNNGCYKGSNLKHGCEPIYE